MTIYQIALPQTNGRAFSFSTQLSGLTFRFTFEHCVLDNSWYFHLSTGNGQRLLSGQRCVVNYPLIQRLTDNRKPAGNLVLVDLSDAGLDPGLSDLGARVQLFYNDGV